MTEVSFKALQRGTGVRPWKKLLQDNKAQLPLLLTSVLACVHITVAHAKENSGEVESSGGGGIIGSLFSVVLGFVAIIAFAVVAILGFVTYSRLNQPSVPAGSKLPPAVSTGMPVLGNFIAFAKNPIKFIQQGKESFGGIFTLDLLAEQCTILSGHKYHQVFFEASDEDLEQAPVYNFMTPIFGKNVIYDAPLQDRRQQMRALGACLKPSQLRKYSKIIAKEAHDYFKNNWGEEGQVDLLPSLAELIILTASATLLGPEVRNELFLEVSKLYELLDKGLTPLSIFFPYAPIAAHSKRDEARKEMGKLFSRVIKKRKEVQQTDETDRLSKIDMLQKLIDFEYKDGRKLSDDEITGLLVAALFAGQHTSSITTTWSIVFLLNDKKNHGGAFFNKVMEELGELEQSAGVPGAFSKGSDLDSRVIQQETHLYNAVKESVRMYPPLILLMRRVQKSITTEDGYFIPKGNRLMVSNAVAQRLPEVFEKPDTWNPDRWNEFDMAKLPKYSFIGFGAGIHTCMGESFAFLQIRTILTVMFSMYEVDLVTELPEANYDAMVVPPKGPNIVKFKLRKEADGNMLSQLFYPSKDTSKAEIPKAVQEVQSDADPTAQGEMDPTNTYYSLAEIATHNKKDDAWLVVKGKVYDVSNYVHLHQGGDAAILNFAGKPDATEAVFGPQHPKTVPTLLERFHIGHVKKE